jgi:GMP synthase (glutamine-hydrolysing)
MTASHSLPAMNLAPSSPLEVQFSGSKLNRCHLILITNGVNTGIMGAYDEEEFPFLIDEKKWLAANTRDNAPILGICLGCQLLADALGGKAYRTPSGHELGFPSIELNAAAHSDPVLSAPGIDVASKSLEYVLCHGDTWDLPPGGTLLASSDRCPQVFRLNAALGVQFHPEATADMFTNWLQSVRDSYVKSGRTPPLTEEQEIALNQRTQATEPALKQRAYALFSAWIRTIPALKHHVEN